MPATKRVNTNRRNNLTKCHLSIPFVDDTSSLVSNVIEQLPPPLNDNPALVIGLGALGLVGVSTLLLPPARLLSNQALEEIVQDTYIGQQLQSNRNNNNVSLTCVYKASRDGWSATAFHDKVDTLGSGIVAAQPAFGGRVFGGFNPSGWRSTDDYTTATTAFLWCIISARQKRGRQRSSPNIQKYKILPSSPAIFDYATAGPCFGASDLVIGPPKAAILGGFAGPDMEDRNVNAGSLRTANSLPGQAYETDQNWPVRGYRVPLKEVEVYCLVQK